MIAIGLGVGTLGFFSESIFFRDYWRPPLLLQVGNFGGIEDFLFGLAAGGIGSVAYDVLFKKRLRSKNNPHHWIVPFVLISEVASVAIFYGALGLNSIYASSIGLLIPSLLVILLRKDLIWETLLSAVLAGATLILIESALLVFAPTYLERYFLLYGSTKLIFGLAPITELIWGMSFGAIVGSVYEFDYGKSPVRK